jgi:hypothetical protein
MNGYGSHTFMWVNAGGERFWVKYHFKTEQGVENFTDAEAKAMTAEDPDFHRADLWDAIETGDSPGPGPGDADHAFEDAADYRFNPFDLTKVWPHSDYPMIPIGRMVLDRNPDNYFAQVEQAAFEPSNMVPGIAPSPDKMLQGRLFSYPDTHRYRIGPNYLQLPVNQPLVPVHSYSQDGPMNFRPGGDPVYAPNSYGGPQGRPAHYADPAYQAHGRDRPGRLPRPQGRHRLRPARRTMYRDVMSETDREHLLTNIIGHATHGPGLDARRGRAPGRANTGASRPRPGSQGGQGAERADLGSELVRSTSRYEDALERIAWPASSDPHSAELQELAEERQRLREAMVVIQERTQHMDARNVHTSDPQGFEDALDEAIRQVRAILVKEAPQLELVDATLTTSELREQFTSDIAHAIRHASERPNPPRTAVGRALANIGVKLDRNVQDVSTPQHPAADTTQA